MLNRFEMRRVTDFLLKLGPLLGCLMGLHYFPDDLSTANQIRHSTL